MGDKIGNEYRHLLREWMDALLSYMLSDPKHPSLDGALLCPACTMIHGRCHEAVYPLLFLAEDTGETKYLDAARKLFRWSSYMLCDDGSLYNDSQSAWNGTTVFAAISLEKALRYHGKLLTVEEKGIWEKRLWEMALWLREGITPEKKFNINYIAANAAAIQEAGAKWHKALKPLLVDTGFYASACRQSNAEGFIYCTTTFLYNPQTVRLVEEEILDLEIRHATRVFSIAVFERLNDGVRFVVCNTHPAPPEEELEKYARNMADLTALTVQVINEYAGLPVIIAGDFNTPEQSEQYLNYMRETGVRDAKYEAETLVCGCSTYFGYQVPPDPENMDSCIDHLFISDGATVKLFSAIIGHGVQNASDHIPIYADIALK